MDYARFNYVAQPGDGVTEKGILPRIGEYDKWVIQWGYTYTGAGSMEEDKKIAVKWVLDSLQSNPRLWFGGEGNVVTSHDPRSQTEDLGDNSIKASEYGMKNLKIVMANLQEWTKEENDTYDNMQRMYDRLVNQYRVYTEHVSRNVGGMYETIKTVEQSGDIYKPVPKSIQKDAVGFLNKEVFQTPNWLLDKNVLNKFRKPARTEYPQKIQEMVLTNLLSSGRLYRMSMESMRYGNEVYSVDEMLTDLNKGLWSELKTHKHIDSYRSFLQKRYVDFSFLILSFVGKPVDPNHPDITNTDVPVVLQAHLEQIRKACLAAIPYSKDPINIAHLKYIADKIQLKLNPDLAAN
jgi:hypothetical protein